MFVLTYNYEKISLIFFGSNYSFKCLKYEEKVLFMQFFLIKFQKIKTRSKQIFNNKKIYSDFLNREQNAQKKLSQPKKKASNAKKQFVLLRCKLLNSAQ